MKVEALNLIAEEEVHFGVRLNSGFLLLFTLQNLSIRYIFFEEMLHDRQ